MRVADLIETLEAIAPPEYAEEWDNVGLLVGDREREVSGPTLLTIDFTEEVLEEARGMKADFVVAYHPPLFHARKRLTSEDATGRVLLGAIESGISVYSPHTAIDAAPGGVTDWLCDLLAPKDSEAGASIGDRRALTARTALASSQTHKLVIFVPEEHADGLREALASIGAGRIGAYELCSFAIPGQGTFHAPDGAQPAVGEVGNLERVSEVRLEMVCPGRSLGLAAEIIRQFHPYEEPAWDVYPLGAKPERSIGAGRRVTLDQPALVDELALRLKDRLGVSAVKVATASDEPVERVGLCPGAGASLLDAAVSEGCTLFVTGEMRHHEALAALAQGCSVVLAGHTNTERGYLPQLATRINELRSEAKVVVSKADRSPFHVW